MVPRDKESGIFWVDEEWMEIYFLAKDYDGTKEWVLVMECLHKSLLALWGANGLGRRRSADVC